MTDIRIEVRGLEKVTKMLKDLPRGTIGAAIEAYTDYLIGNEQHGLKHYPAYKYISRKSAYGTTFFSDRQRRWFFAALKSGKLVLPYRRTDTLRNGWVKTGTKWQRIIRNRTPYIGVVMGESEQSRMSKKIGWRKVSAVIESNAKGALRAAQQAVSSYLKSKKKS